MHTPRPFVKRCYGRNEKGSVATDFGTPQSLISLNSIGKALQIRDFAKRNRTPIVIRIVSKLVSSYGRSAGTRTPGLLLPKQARYQLRNTPMSLLILRNFHRKVKPGENITGKAGNPLTFGRDAGTVKIPSILAGSLCLTAYIPV